MNKLGIYFLSNTSGVVEHVRRLQPSWVVLHDGEVKQENIDLIKSVSPGTKVCCRIYYADNSYEEAIMRDPQGAARHIAEQMLGLGLRGVDAWLTTNEVLTDWHELDNMVAYYKHLMELFFEPLMLITPAVKNPGDELSPDGWPHWQKLFQILYRSRELGRLDYISLHQYAKPHMLNGVDQPFAPYDLDGVVRFEELIWQRMPEDLKDFPIVITEFGPDFLIGYPGVSEKGGWLHPNACTGPDNMSWQVERFFEAWDERYGHLGIPIEGWIWYAWGDSGGWAGYDISAREWPEMGVSYNEPFINYFPYIPAEGIPQPPDPEPPEIPSQRELLYLQGLLLDAAKAIADFLLEHNND